MQRACRWQAGLAERRRVVAVNEVVRHAWMVWLLGEHRLEYRRRFLLIGVGLVGGERGRIQRKRVEDGRLPVLGVILMEARHRVLVGEGAGGVGKRVAVA